MKASDQSIQVTIPAPKMHMSRFRIVGTAPYVQHRFGQKAMQQIKQKQLAGSTANKKKQREARDFEEDYKQAMHIATDGWIGIPVSAIRAGCISACRLCGFKMTLAKLSIFVEADGVDKVDGVPLIRIEGKPEPVEHYVRMETGTVSLAIRPMWREWEAVVRMTYDADQFTVQDVANLLARVGLQVGIGEGRPDSKKGGGGMGWGTFRIADQE